MSSAGKALKSGQGTPWGASRYGDPSAVSLSDYQNDPNKYQSFDRSDLANKAVADINSDTANNLAQAKARMAATGTSRGSGANVLQMNMMNAGANRGADVRNQNALAGWQDKLNQMNMENQFNLNRDSLSLNKYKTEAGLAEAERQQRRQNLSKLGPLGDLANLFGNY